MNELFQKNINYLGLNLDLTKNDDGTFQDEETQKQWLAFRTVYMRGRKSAFDDMGVWAVQNVGVCK